MIKTGEKIWLCTVTGFKDGKYKIQSGEMISVCMTSDFFLEEADPMADGCMGHNPEKK